MTKKHMAYIWVSPELLADRLDMPEGCQIIGVKWDFDMQAIRLYLEGDMLPEVPEAQDLPRVNLVYELNKGSRFE